MVSVASAKEIKTIDSISSDFPLEMRLMTNQQTQGLVGVVNTTENIDEITLQKIVDSIQVSLETNNSHSEASYAEIFIFDAPNPMKSNEIMDQTDAYTVVIKAYTDKNSECFLNQEEGSDSENGIFSSVKASSILVATWENTEKGLGRLTAMNMFLAVTKGTVKSETYSINGKEENVESRYVEPNQDFVSKISVGYDVQFNNSSKRLSIKFDCVAEH